MSRSKGSESPTEYVLRNRERIELAQLRAIREGAVDPVVLAIDLCSPLGMAIAEEVGRGAEASAHVAEAEARGVASQLLGGMPRSEARSILEDVSPLLAGILDSEESPRHFSVFAIVGRAIGMVQLPDVSGC